MLRKGILLVVLYTFFFIVSVKATSSETYYKAGEGDVVSVNFQRYEADKTEIDGGHLVVYLGEGSVPLDLKDRWPDAMSVIRGFRMAILGGSTSAKDYGEPMEYYPDDPLRPLDKKEWVVVPPEDGYSSGQSLYFDIILNSIYYDAVKEPFESEESSSTDSDTSKSIPGFGLLIAVLGLAALVIVDRGIH